MSGMFGRLHTLGRRTGRLPEGVDADRRKDPGGKVTIGSSRRREVSKLRHKSQPSRSILKQASLVPQGGSLPKEDVHGQGLSQSDRYQDRTEGISTQTKAPASTST